MRTTISLCATGVALCSMLSGPPAYAQTKSVLDAGVQDTVKQFNKGRMDDYDSYNLKRPVQRIEPR